MLRLILRASCGIITSRAACNAASMVMKSSQRNYTAEGCAEVSLKGALKYAQIPVRKHQRWTPGEDAVLLKEMEKARMGGRKPSWSSVAKVVGRKYHSVYCRWERLDSSKQRHAPQFPRVSKGTSHGSGRKSGQASLELATQSEFVDQELRKGKWNNSETEILKRKVFAALQVRKLPSWALIGRCMGRSGISVRDRWDRISHDKRIPWSKYEDELIVEQVQSWLQSGAKPYWSQISRQLGRNRVAVVRRWQTLDPSFKRGKWSREEAAALEEDVRMVVRDGARPQWTEIGRALRRPGYAVQRKWARMCAQRNTST